MMQETYMEEETESEIPAQIERGSMIILTPLAKVVAVLVTVGLVLAIALVLGLIPVYLSSNESSTTSSSVTVNTSSSNGSTNLTVTSTIGSISANIGRSSVTCKSNSYNLTNFESKGYSYFQGSTIDSSLRSSVSSISHSFTCNSSNIINVDLSIVIYSSIFAFEEKDISNLFVGYKSAAQAFPLPNGLSSFVASTDSLIKFDGKRILQNGTSIELAGCNFKPGDSKPLNSNCQVFSITQQNEIKSSQAPSTQSSSVITSGKSDKNAALSSLPSSISSSLFSTTLKLVQKSEETSSTIKSDSSTSVTSVTSVTSTSFATKEQSTTIAESLISDTSVSSTSKTTLISLNSNAASTSTPKTTTISLSTLLTSAASILSNKIDASSSSSSSLFSQSSTTENKLPTYNSTASVAYSTKTFQSVTQSPSTFSSSKDTSVSTIISTAKSVVSTGYLTNSTNPATLPTTPQDTVNKSAVYDNLVSLSLSNSSNLSQSRALSVIVAGLDLTAITETTIKVLKSASKSDDVTYNWNRVVNSLVLQAKISWVISDSSSSSSIANSAVIMATVNSNKNSILRSAPANVECIVDTSAVKITETTIQLSGSSGTSEQCSIIDGKATCVKSLVQVSLNGSIETLKTEAPFVQLVTIPPGVTIGSLILGVGQINQTTFQTRISTVSSTTGYKSIGLFSTIGRSTIATNDIVPTSKQRTELTTKGTEKITSIKLVTTASTAKFTNSKPTTSSKTSITASGSTKIVTSNLIRNSPILATIFSTNLKTYASTQGYTTGSKSASSGYVTTKLNDNTSRGVTIMVTTNRSTTNTPNTVKPTTFKLSTVQPTAVKLTTIQPTTFKLATVQPTAVKLTTIQPTTFKLATVQPTTFVTTFSTSYGTTYVTKSDTSMTSFSQSNVQTTLGYTSGSTDKLSSSSYPETYSSKSAEYLTSFWGSTSTSSFKFSTSCASTRKPLVFTDMTPISLTTGYTTNLQANFNNNQKNDSTQYANTIGSTGFTEPSSSGYTTNFANEISNPSSVKANTYETKYSTSVTEYSLNSTGYSDTRNYPSTTVTAGNTLFQGTNGYTSFFIAFSDSNLMNSFPKTCTSTRRPLI